MAETYLQVAVPNPLNRLFDYAAPTDGPSPQPGMRVRVPFGRREQIGVIARLTHVTDVPVNKLKAAIEVLDAQPLLNDSTLQMLAWASSYYLHPPGEVYATALPAALRHGGTPEPSRIYEWLATDAGHATDHVTLLKKAKVQGLLLKAVQQTPQTEAALRELNANWTKVMATLANKGLVERREAQPATPAQHEPGPQLTDAQQKAVAAVPAEGFNPCLLHGVTGSGKTEVYLHLIEQQLAAGRQSLVLVPEIGLTPQLIERFRKRLPGRVEVTHSGLTDQQRLNTWLSGRSGEADVIIGTRSGIFIPLKNPGLIVIDEEHDSSFKQQDGFRYSARDLAVWRAHQLQIPVMLGSATPAFETLNNALEGRYQHLVLPARPGKARQPDIHCIDLRTNKPMEGLSKPFLDAMRRHLQDDGQVLIYLNRRGFAPTLLCPTCGTTEECLRCDARMVLHQKRRRLICHHCGSERPLIQNCGDCGDELIAVGQGTERLEQALTDKFPDYPLLRIDRDTTRRRGSMEEMLGAIRAGDARILLGTQMLTKGHDFPNVTFVGIVDCDQGLFGTDFRASEKLAQSVLQVAGRAGRADRPGEVWIQTWYPDHPLLQSLFAEGYDAFATGALVERKAAGWPPHSHIALLRAENARREVLFDFLNKARLRAGNPGDTVSLLGPAASPMEKRGGRFRGQLLIRSASRGALHQFLAAWRAALEAMPESRKTRWSLDIDPAELF